MCAEQRDWTTSLSVSRLSAHRKVLGVVGRSCHPSTAGKRGGTATKSHLFGASTCLYTVNHFNQLPPLCNSMHAYTRAFLHAYIPACMHACMHACIQYIDTENKLYYVSLCKYVSMFLRICCTCSRACDQLYSFSLGQQSAVYQHGYTCLILFLHMMGRGQDLKKCRIAGHHINRAACSLRDLPTQHSP